MQKTYPVSHLTLVSCDTQTSTTEFRNMQNDTKCRLLPLMTHELPVLSPIPCASRTPYKETHNTLVSRVDCSSTSPTPLLKTCSLTQETPVPQNTRHTPRGANALVRMQVRSAIGHVLARRCAHQHAPLARCRLGSPQRPSSGAASPSAMNPASLLAQSLPARLETKAGRGRQRRSNLLFFGTHTSLSETRTCAFPGCRRLRRNSGAPVHSLSCECGAEERIPFRW